MHVLTNVLKGKGIRPSVQRISILNFLIENRVHPSADDIFDALSPTMPTLSRATVYNTLNLFAEKGVVRTMNIFGSEHHYDGVLTGHGHVVCPCCGKINDFDYDNNDLESLGRLKSRTGAESVEFVINKKCNNCNKI